PRRHKQRRPRLDVGQHRARTGTRQQGNVRGRRRFAGGTTGRAGEGGTAHDTYRETGNDRQYARLTQQRADPRAEAAELTEARHAHGCTTSEPTALSACGPSPDAVAMNE